MEWFYSILNALRTALVDKFWGEILYPFVPKIVGAIIVFVIGYWVAKIIASLIAEVLKMIKFDKIFDDKGWSDAMKKAEIDVKPSEFFAGIVKWILIILFMVGVADVLGLPEFSKLLSGLVGYLPNVIVAVLIFIATVIITDLLEKIIIVSIGGIKVNYATAVGAFVRWVIWVFAFFAMLMQLGIAEALVFALFQGIIYILVLAFGLSFGLGGKDAAADFIKSIKDKIRK